MRKIGKLSNIKLRTAQLEILSLVISKAKSQKEALAVINSLFSPSEKNAIAQRLAIILRVFRGDTYADIETEYGSSPSTITKATDYYLKYDRYNSAFKKVIANIDPPSINAKTPINTKGEIPDDRFVKPNYPGAIKL